MTRGNQRDLAREKNLKKQQQSNKGAASHEGNAGMTLEQRKQRDADIMRQKQLAKQAAAGGQSDGNGPGTSSK